MGGWEQSRLQRPCGSERPSLALSRWVQAPGLKGVSWLVPGPPPRGAPRSSSKLRQLLGSFPAHALQNPEKGR